MECRSSVHLRFPQLTGAVTGTHNGASSTRVTDSMSGLTCYSASPHDTLAQLKPDRYTIILAAHQDALHLTCYRGARFRTALSNPFPQPYS